MPPDRYNFGMPALKKRPGSSHFYLLFKAFGEEYYGKNMKPLFDSGAGIKAKKLMAEILKKINPLDCITWDFPEMVITFATGQPEIILIRDGNLGIISDADKSQVIRKYGFISALKD